MRSEKIKRKNPLVALLLSAVLPGLGQIYNTQILKGLVLVGLNFAISFLVKEPLILVLESSGPLENRPGFIVVLGYAVAGLALLIFSMIDAKKTADTLNKDIEST